MSAPEKPSTIDYPELLRNALVGMLRGILARVAQEGLPGEHHFYLTFRTDGPGVVLSPTLLRQHPKELTIVLQHQFWNLEVDDTGFAVTLRFAGVPERVVVPFSALTAFVDPSAGLGFRLTEEAESEAPATKPGEPAASAADGEAAPTGRVVAFRRPGGETK